MIPPTGGALGGVKQGSNITIAADGTISGVNSYTLSAANPIGLGGVKIDGTFMTIDGSGNIKSPLDIRYNSSLWQETAPIHGNIAWHDAVMNSSNGTYRAAIIYGGHLYVSNNGGLTWTAKLTDTNRNWHKVSVSSTGEKMVAVADGQQIYVSVDYGVTWTATYNSLAYRSVAVAPDGSRATAVVYPGRIHTTTDFINWSQASTPNTNLNWYDVAMSNDGQIQTAVTNGEYQYIIIEGSSHLLRSADSGVSWSSLTNSPVNLGKIATNNTGSIVYTAASTGAIFRSINYGASWTIFDVNTNATSYINRSWTSISTTSDGTNLMATLYNVPILINPAPRWTTTFGLSTNAVQATSVTSLLGTITSLSGVTSNFTTSVSAAAVMGMFYGDGSNLTNLSANYIATGTIASARLPIATDLIVGGVKQGANITIAADGTISGVNSYVLPEATASILGGVKIGSGLSVSGGVVSLSAPSGGTLGGVKQGANITIAPDGTISGVNSYVLPNATTSIVGGVSIGDGLSVTNGNVSLVAASDSARGGIRVDNTTVKISNTDVIYVDQAALNSIASSSFTTNVVNPVISTEFVPVSNNKNSVIVLTINVGESYPFKIPKDAELNFSIGTQFTVVQGGLVPITITSTDVAVVNIRSFGLNRITTAGQNAVATIIKIAANTWLAGGNLI